MQWNTQQYIVFCAKQYATRGTNDLTGRGKSDSRRAVFRQLIMAENRIHNQF
jgi:hypothetical protein